MSIRRPTTDQMREVISSLHMTMSESETQEYMALMEGSFQAYDRIDALPDNIPEVAYPRTPGSRPAAQDNPMNAWYVKTEVKGANSGPLQGKKIVLKDNVSLAGVLMMNGASTLEGYVPDMDATVVRRILDAGGTIVGKAHCEYFCLSGGSHTNATGPVHNPWRMGYIAGGSSSGCGALVGAGEIEMAIGGDQGGSIRIPSAFCGAYGMKPTHGLVPYTGIMPIEATIDHAGPITSTVADNALLLEVIAGADGLDPRQYSPRVDKYTSALGRGINGLRIGVVREGFELPNMESDVANKVRQAVDRLVKLGAIAEEISIPMHLDGAAIWTPIALEGLQAQMMHGNGMGFNWEGLYSTSLMDRHASWRNRANELSPTLKISMFVGEYALRQYGGRFYAKAQNLSRLLRSKYDEALNQYDLLLMPTLPIKAKPIPAPGAPLSEVIERAFEMIGNTAPFDASGHPAMSVPVGLCDGLPVGMMLIGKHWGESTIYRAAHAFEQSGDWKNF
jgi:amidase